MAIVAVTPIYLRQFAQAAIPLPTQNAAVDTSEIVFATDTGRLFTGVNPAIGSPYDSREYFPYSYMEVLTEFSPRVQELFQLFYRNQNFTAFYHPAIIPPNTANYQVAVQSYDGSEFENVLPAANNVSSSIQYQAVTSTTAIKSGNLRVLAANGSVVFADQSGETSNTLSFHVTYNANSGYILSATNSGSEAIHLYVKQMALTGATQNLEPPVWNTAAGSLGTYANGSALSQQLSATDPQGLPVAYFISNGAISIGLTLSSTGRITGSIANSSTFTVRASDGTVYSDRNFSFTVT